MTGVLRKGIVLLVIIFIGFYMFNDPDGLAQVVKEGGGNLKDGLQNLFTALIDFLNAVTS
jgi:hypothetical protein